MPALATITQDGMKVRDRFGVMNFGTTTRPEAASQTWNSLDVLTISSGQVSQGVTTGNKLSSSGNVIAGLAVNKASGTTNADAEIYPASPRLLVRMPVYHATPASAVTARSQYNTTGYQLYYNSTYGWMVSIADTTNPVVRVVEIDTTAEAIGSAYGYVWVQFIASVTEDA